MSQTESSFFIADFSVPRASGDEPLHAPVDFAENQCSPRERG